MIELSYKVLLGSKSPRRREILDGAGISFSIVDIDVEESFPKELDAAQVAEFLALKKSNAFKNLKEQELLITSDTVVVLDTEILGKPKDEVDALNMLRKLSGKEHVVYSGVALRTLGKTISFTDSTIVKFRDLSDAELGLYIKRYKPFDKAGSYGVQDWMGMTGVEYIRGSYYNVMGLPMHALYHELKKYQR